MPLTEFVDYVDNMHTDKNTLFEKEFNVRAVNVCTMSHKETYDIIEPGAYECRMLISS